MWRSIAPSARRSGGGLRFCPCYNALCESFACVDLLLCLTRGLWVAFAAVSNSWWGFMGLVTALACIAGFLALVHGVAVVISMYSESPLLGVFNLLRIMAFFSCTAVA